MDKLVDEACVACRPGSPRVTEEELPVLLQAIPEWALVEQSGAPRLQRTFRFPDFASALKFAQEVGRLAEAEGHHPRLTVEWGRVTVTWWTHAIKALHRNDFIMAAKTDAAALR